MIRTGTSSHSEDSAKLGRFRVEMLLGFTASACLKGTYIFTRPVLAAAMRKMRGARSTARFGTASTDLTGTHPNIACARGAHAVHATPPKRCDFSEQRRRIQRKTTRPGDARAQSRRHLGLIDLCHAQDRSHHLVSLILLVCAALRFQTLATTRLGYGIWIHASANTT